MHGLYSVVEIRRTLTEGRARAAGFLRERWYQLQRRNEQARDPAWISLATEEQLESQISALERRDLKSCPLYGVPFAVKDNIDVSDWETTAACPEFAYVDARVREQALFWLAQKAGKKVVASLNEAVERDPEFEVKKKAVFALSQLPKDEAIPQLVHVADTNSNLAIREEAIFWLGQSNDPRAFEYLEAVLKR